MLLLLLLRVRVLLQQCHHRHHYRCCLLQARFSTLEFVKSTEGCGECEGRRGHDQNNRQSFEVLPACPGFAPRFCGKGLCTASSFYDRTLEGGWGARWTSLLPNQFETEEPESLLACACDEGVEGDSCEVGVCATVNCNEPFGGFCNETGICTCINGYHGEHCKISPKLDQFGCLDMLGFSRILCDTQNKIHSKS